MHERDGFCFWKFAGQYFSIFNAEHSFRASKYRVNTGNMMLLIISLIHAHNNAIKHGYDWHRKFLRKLYLTLRSDIA